MNAPPFSQAIVFDKAVNRRLMQLARSILDTCSIDKGEATAAVESAQKAVHAFAEGKLDGKAQETHSTLTGIDTGYYELNDKTGGLQNTDLVVLGARPSIAKELEMPVLVLSQLSRGLEYRGSDRRPQLSDLRESGSIEKDADIVMFIVRPWVYDHEADEREAQLLIAKQRNGPTADIDLVFQKKFTRFEDAESHHHEDGQPL